ncbi:hypothetical protein GCM10009777_36590 [Microbacterium pumilum]|uniref:Uncharacterized protein n=1 Tax=Microbacterium pumilum TaxID=344165 RepID=A0ABP5EJA2_9MICO
MQRILVLLGQHLREPVRDTAPDPHADLPNTELPQCGESARSADEDAFGCDCYGLEEPLTLDRFGKRIDVAEIGTVSRSDPDGVDGSLKLDVPLLVHGRRQGALSRRLAKTRSS